MRYRAASTALSTRLAHSVRGRQHTPHFTTLLVRDGERRVEADWRDVEEGGDSLSLEIRGQARVRQTKQQR